MQSLISMGLAAKNIFGLYKHYSASYLGIKKILSLGVYLQPITHEIETDSFATKRNTKIRNLHKNNPNNGRTTNNKILRQTKSRNSKNNNRLQRKNKMDNRAIRRPRKRNPKNPALLRRGQNIQHNLQLRRTRKNNKNHLSKRTINKIQLQRKHN